MITLPETLQIHVATSPIDMRKAIDGLCIAVKDHLQSNPQGNALYVFYNGARNKVKALYWDKNGFVMIYKRLEKGRFQFTKETSVSIEIDHKQLSWLLAGFDFMRMPGYPDLDFTGYC